MIVAPLRMKKRKGKLNSPNLHPRQEAGLLISSLRSIHTERGVFRLRLLFALNNHLDFPTQTNRT
ncbi:protein of unknown function [Georgfuchsia toluolica]|uniref:Uncharacterized protein n=1 Tax=Georgfuchsia toluolica TaxID=424218 RepID=A0A916J6H3_9PROT|nr:protein of unknown function [Georgfuchsia toluolica]